jgi:hypothetical protein
MPLLVLVLLWPVSGAAQPEQGDGEETPAELGQLRYTIVPGSKKYCPSDSKPGSFLKTYGQPISHKVCNGTKGNFRAEPLILEGGAPDVAGIARLRLQVPFVVGANLDQRAPRCGKACVSCWRFAPVPEQPGWVDCDGGSNADATLVIDSKKKRPPPPPRNGTLTVAATSQDGGPGAAALPVRVQYVRLNETSRCPAVDSTRWEQDDVTVLDTVMVTGEAVSTIHNPRRCAPAFNICPRENPYQVTLRGANLSCSQWKTPPKAQFVIPLHSLDTSILGKIVVGDVAQVLRLTAKPHATRKSGHRSSVGETAYADVTPATPHRLRTPEPRARDLPVFSSDR